MRIFPVRGLYVSAADWSREPELAARLSQAAAARGVPVHLLAAGDRLELPPLRLRVLHPPPGWKSARGNANSLVLLGQGFGADFLLTGDIDLAVERELAEAGALPPAAVLKAAHHGSRTSSGEAFLESVRPGLVLISSGPPERFSHPSPVVIEPAGPPGHRAPDHPRRGADRRGVPRGENCAWSTRRRPSMPKPMMHVAYITAVHLIDHMYAYREIFNQFMDFFRKSSGPIRLRGAKAAGHPARRASRS